MPRQKNPVASRARGQYTGLSEIAIFLLQSFVHLV